MGRASLPLWKWQAFSLALGPQGPQPNPTLFRSWNLPFVSETQALQLHKATLFFLPLTTDRWFNTSDLIMTPNEMRNPCTGWAFAVDEARGIKGIWEPTLAVLLDMINFPHWRPHIATDKWKLLEHFASVPDDSQPLVQCLKNTDLVDTISEVDNPDAIVLWSIVLWSKYEKLIPKVMSKSWKVW